MGYVNQGAWGSQDIGAYQSDASDAWAHSINEVASPTKINGSYYSAALAVS